MEPRRRRSVVVGGAGGLGAAVARGLAEAGGLVAVLDRDLEGARAVAGEIDGVAGEIDVSDEASVGRAIDEAATRLGGLDALVTTAGVLGERLDLEQTSLARWQEVIAVNLTGTFLVCRAALGHLRSGDRPSVVTVASGVALRPLLPTLTAYAASKGGVVAFSKTLAQQVGPDGIRVNVVCPGLVETPMAPSRAELGEADTGRLEQYALGRAATAEEIAEVICLVSGPAASYMTGSTVVVDGGRSYW
ncbi:SDR family NAD(P)-dependent oxidoreductase [Nocardioides acrostichi]|nr:SDR family NAD(P)-dependent oxidoreductase [Nocardioides acrostichi]